MKATFDQFNLIGDKIKESTMRPFILLLSLSLFAACPGGEDTCNAVLGDTFTDVINERLSPNPDGGYDLTLALNALDTLPPAYFEAAAITRMGLLPNGEELGADGQDATIIESTPTRLRLQVGPGALADDTIELLIRYPDRQDFIDCEHPGSGDTYRLFLNYQIADTSNVRFDWEEVFSAGGF